MRDKLFGKKTDRIRENQDRCARDDGWRERRRYLLHQQKDDLDGVTIPTNLVQEKLLFTNLMFATFLWHPFFVLRTLVTFFRYKIDRGPSHQEPQESLSLWRVIFSNSLFYNSDCRFRFLVKKCVYKVSFFFSFFDGNKVKNERKMKNWGVS